MNGPQAALHGLRDNSGNTFTHLPSENSNMEIKNKHIDWVEWAEVTWKTHVVQKAESLFGTHEQPRARVIDEQLKNCDGTEGNSYGLEGTI